MVKSSILKANHELAHGTGGRPTRVMGMKAGAPGGHVPGGQAGGARAWGGKPAQVTVALTLDFIPLVRRNHCRVLNKELQQQSCA